MADLYLKQHIENEHVNKESEAEIIFKCDKCDISVRSNDLLKEHNKVHHKEKCNYCDEVFMNIKTLEAHLRSSHNMHKCEICANNFGSSEELNEHSNFHLMNECMTPEEASEHMKTGYCKEFTFICGECSESFETKRDCITHMNKHESCYLNSDPIPTYPCDECNEIHISKQASVDHKAQNHNNLNNGEELGIKIDNSLNLLYKNVHTSLVNLNTKFDLSLSKVDNIVSYQNKVIKELTEKVEVLASIIHTGQKNDISTKIPYYFRTPQYSRG